MHAALTPEDLQEVWSLLPYTAQALVGCIGAQRAALLLNSRPGCSFLMPKHPDANESGAKRWAELVSIIGDEGTALLAARWGGDGLDVPTCQQARRELLRRKIRAAFDDLTKPGGLSGQQAVYELCLRFAPISSRAVEKICGRPDIGEPAQAELQF
jgi:hypothetical protein